MTQNTIINANVAATVAEKKEEKVMMNGNMALAFGVAEMKEMKVDALKMAAKVFKIKGYSKMKKADLIKALKPYTIGTASQYRKGEVNHIYTVNPLDDPEVMAVDVSDEALLQPIAPTPVVEVPVGDLSITKDTMKVKEDNDMDDNKKKEKNRVALALVVAWVYQSTHSVTNDNRVLFYFPTKRVDLKGVKIASRKRLSKVTGDLLGWMYGKELKNETFRKWVDSAYDVALEAGLCHKNGDDIHMSAEEWNKCVNFYNKDYMKDSIKKYADFVASKK